MNKEYIKIPGEYETIEDTIVEIKETLEAPIVLNRMTIKDIQNTIDYLEKQKIDFINQKDEEIRINKEMIEQFKIVLNLS